MEFTSSKIFKLIGKINQPVILEVGAHVGSDTREFVNCYPDAKIFCFEPDPRCSEQWKQQRFGENVRLFEIAISDEDKKIHLNISEARYPISSTGIRKILRRLLRRQHMEVTTTSLGQSSIANATSRTDAYPWLVFTHKIEVAAMKLDTWRMINMPDVPVIDFVWTDVQGAEKRLIQGALKTLAKTRFITLEYGATNVYDGAMSREETIKMMGDNCFRLLDDYSDLAPEGNLVFANTRI